MRWVAFYFECSFHEPGCNPEDLGRAVVNIYVVHNCFVHNYFVHKNAFIAIGHRNANKLAPDEINIIGDTPTMS